MVLPPGRLAVVLRSADGKIESGEMAWLSELRASLRCERRRRCRLQNDITACRHRRLALRSSVGGAILIFTLQFAQRLSARVVWPRRQSVALAGREIPGRPGLPQEEQYSFSPYSSPNDYQRVLFGLEGSPWRWLDVKFQGGPDFRRRSNTHFHPTVRPTIISACCLASKAVRG